jgi:pimeloyl-ACP methyl ester carboxylesterase
LRTGSLKALSPRFFFFVKTMQDTFYLDGLYVEHVRPSGETPRHRPPILLVHGAGHGAWCWEGWMAALPALGWEAYALSLRNHPGSRTVYWLDFLKRLRVEDYADDAEAVLNRIGRPAMVFGHSMGGVVTQALAARRGKAGRPLAAMVLVAAAPPGALPPIRDAPLPTDAPYWLTEADARKRYFHSAPEGVVQRALARLVPESPAVMNQYSLSPGVDVKPGDLRCPCLCVSAERDGTLVPRDRSLADYYGGDYLFCRGTGHDVMLEAGAEAILKDILTWAEAKARP